MSFGLIWLLIWLCSVVATIVIADQKKLNMAGFILLAVFFSPLGLIIALVASPKKHKEQSYPPAIVTREQAYRELSHLKATLKLLQERISHLERIFGQIFPQQEEQPVLVNAQKAEQHDVVNAGSSETQLSVSKEGFEVTFGKYWLNRIGVVIFVLGIGLFISYTFQSMNAFMKITIGYLLAAAFFFWGNFLAKREKYVKLSWGILGGAWSLLYLTTYAMHYIETTRLISSSVTIVVLLGIVSVAAIIYNLKYASWIVTAITYFLAFITVGLGVLDYSTPFYCALITGSIVYLSYRRNWWPLLIFGVIGCYVTFSYWVDPYNHSPLYWFTNDYHPGSYEPPIMAWMLAICWILFSSAFLIMKKDDPSHQRYRIAGVSFNALFFTLLGLQEINRIQWQHALHEDFWFLIALGLFYVLFAALHGKNKQRNLIVLNVSVACLLFDLAILIRMPETSITILWFLEMIVLFIVGLYYQEKPYRTLAGVFGIFVVTRLVSIDYFRENPVYPFLDWTLSYSAVSFTLVSLTFLVFGIFLSKEKIKNRLTAEEYKFYSYAFPIAGTILLTSILSRDMPDRWLSLVWTGEGIAILALGFVMINRIYRVCALCLLSLACVRVVFIDFQGINTIYKIMAFIFLGMVLLGISLVYSRIRIQNKN